MSRSIGAAGLALIQRFEGCRLTAYKAVPTEKYWTIGWGHYGPNVQEGDKITQAEADAMLVADVQRYADYVDETAQSRGLVLNDNQRDALISFTYNCGYGSLASLTRTRAVNEIGPAMELYNKAGGKVLVGLQRRRSAERALYETPAEQEDNMFDIEKLTEEQLVRLAERMNAALGKLPVSDKLAGELEAAKAAGITNGANPAALVTRAQAAVMAYRAGK